MRKKYDKTEYQRLRRKLTNNIYTKRYEKTKSGFLVRAYRNMKSRIAGIQKRKFHLYQGKALWDKKDFYKWAQSNDKFHALFDAWEKSGYDRKLTPSVDRIDSTKGYSFENCEWVTHSENSRRSSQRRIKC